MITKLRKKILLLVLLGATILWLLAWYQHVSAYNQMREDDIERVGKEIAELIDYYPVWIWGWGQLLLVIGILLAMAWTVIIFEMVKRVKKRITGGSKIMPLMVCGMIVMLTVATLNLSFFAVAEPTPEEEHVFCVPNSVDLLFVSDEELRAKKEYAIIKENGKVEIWYSTRKIEEIVFPHLQKRFLEQTGISVAFNGWVNWSSNDDEHHPIFLLIEAMEQTGWVAEQTYRERTLSAHGLTWKDERRRMDILVVLTLQSMDYYGQAIDKEAAEDLSEILGKTVQWDAVIVKYQVGDVDYSCQFIQHEVSHLFGLSHCSNLLCVMNPEGIFHFEVQWCSSCREELKLWADIIPSEQYPPC